MSVRDGRLAPFCYQSLASVRTIHAHFNGQQRNTALGIYQALTYQANEARTRDDFEASRREIAELAGVSDRTLDKYADDFENLGLLVVTRSRTGDLNLPNRWTLIEPQGGEMASPLANSDQEGSRSDFATGGEMASPNSKKAKKEETPTPPRGQRRTDLAAYRHDCEAFGAEHFSDLGADATTAVDQAVRAGNATLDDVTAFIDKWWRNGGSKG